MRGRAEGRGDRADARGVTRRLFLDGTLKASLVAGLGARLSILDLLAQGAGPTPGAGGAGSAGTGAAVARGYDGELIAESYEIAHRLRDGTLSIPSLLPEGPLHDAIVVGGGVSGLAAAWGLPRV